MVNIAARLNARSFSVDWPSFVKQQLSGNFTSSKAYLGEMITTHMYAIVLIDIFN